MLLFLLAALAAVSPAEIQRQISDTPELKDLVRSGYHLAWTEVRADADRVERYSAVWIAADDGHTPPYRVTARQDDGRERAPTFSPDGQTLAFVSDAEGKAAIYLFDIKTSRVRRLASPAAGLSALHFSSGGTHSADSGPPTNLRGDLRGGYHLSFLGTEAAGFGGAGEALPADFYEVASSEPVQRLGSVDIETGESSWITPPDVFVYAYDESPTDKQWVIVDAHGSGMGNYWNAELALVDGQHVKTLWKSPKQLAHPRFSPDGKRIAVLHGLMSDEGSDGGEVTVLDLATQTTRVLPRAQRGTATWLEWRSANEILTAGVTEGDCFVASQKLGEAHETLLWRDSSTITADHNVGLAVAGTQTAVVRSTFTRPPHIEVGPIGGWKPLGAERHFVAEWGEARRISWKTDIGDVQGWLVPPREIPKRKYPLAVIVHGGPAGATTNGWARRWVGVLASQGYFVFLPNPRGSFGKNEAFTEANVKDFGRGDLRDILAGIDAVAEVAPIDAERIGIVGWSYGGFMAMFAPTQTTRFRAAVAGAGVSNWQSYYGENRINTWMLPYFGASVYDDPAVYYGASAVNFAKKARTPTLILCGDRDAEVPPAQSYEWWNALRNQSVDTKLVVYPGEGHHFRSRTHLDDSILRTLAWLDAHLR